VTIDLQQKIYIAGHRGMVGSAIVRELKRKGYTNLVYRTHQELDLTNQLAVQNFFAQEKPNQVYLAAAKVGGIHANNTYPAEFIYQNLMIEANIIHASFLNNVSRLIFLGSSCAYPNDIKRKISESDLLSSRVEKTNEPYAIAKIAGIKLCESYSFQYGLDYKCLMSCNVYGVNDNYDKYSSHFFPALIRKIVKSNYKICFNLLESLIKSIRRRLNKVLW
jgi:GDP-L-fucose synthase